MDARGEARQRQAEQAWIRQAQEGDDEAFGRLVETFQAPVYNLCLRMLGDPAEAEDAAQEAFLRAYRAFGRYDPDRPLVTWLLTIASRHCLDRLRRRRPEVPFDPVLHPGEEGPGPEAQWAAREEQERVHALIARLRPAERAVLVLRYWYDLPLAEIGQALGLSEAAVKSRLHRARREMARLWHEAAAVREVGGEVHGPSTV